MDLADALGGCSRALAALRGFPSFKAVEPATALYVPATAREREMQALLRACAPVVGNALGELSAELGAFSPGLLAQAEGRSRFIDGRLGEVSRECEVNREKLELIAQIGRLEEQAPPRVARVEFSAEESRDLIFNLHASHTGAEPVETESSLLEEFIDVKYDVYDDVEVAAIQKIIELCDKSVG